MKSRTWKWMIALSLFAALAMPVSTAAQDNPSPDNKHKHKNYRLVDIGTFGGPASGAGALNNRGVVGGSANTNIPDPYNPCPDCFVSHAFEWQHGVLTDLGSLPGINSSVASPMGESQQFFGTSQNGEIDPLLGIPEGRAVIWINRQPIDLGTLGGYESWGLGGNSRGQVVGPSSNTIPDPYSEWGTQTRIFLWEKGAMRDLGTLGGPDVTLFCNTLINDSGQVMGTSYTNSIPNPTTGIPTADPFLWERGVMHDLGGLGGTIGAACAINNRGDVVGSSNLPGDMIFHPFLWERGVLSDLGTFGGETGGANDINDAGDVVGVADLPDGAHDGFLWRNGVMTDLGNLGATSNAHAINSKRQVVGASRMADGITLHAFLWENGGPIVDLNDLIPQNSPLQLIRADFINERGEIAGIGVPAGCEPVDEEVCGHAYLLIPHGECDDECQDRVAQSQAEAELRRQNSAAASHPTGPTVTPVEHIRSMMRQRYHLPGQPAVPRD